MAALKRAIECFACWSCYLCFLLIVLCLWISLLLGWRFALRVVWQDLVSSRQQASVFTLSSVYKEKGWELLAVYLSSASSKVSGFPGGPRTFSVLLCILLLELRLIQFVFA